MLEFKKKTPKLNNYGMTMAELLVVVAILGILAGVAFIAVQNYQRSMAQLERDNIAKEIFVAAQNHLTVTYGEGYSGAGDASQDSSLSVDEKKSKNEKIYGFQDTSDNINYIIVDGGNIKDDKGSDMLQLMLPWGSIDETIRGGSYIIRYQKSTGTVLDVFYWTTSGTPAKFNHTFETADYGKMMSLRDSKDEDNKLKRRGKDNPGGDEIQYVLGWYGGSRAAELGDISLEAPIIKIDNAERLSVTVTDPNYKAGSSEASLQLYVVGETSGAEKYYDLKRTSDNNIEYKENDDAGDGTYKNNHIVILDDITSNNNFHFFNLFSKTSGNIKDVNKEFIPGENLKIRAVAYNNTKFSNIAYSAEKTTNSLFANLAQINETASSTSPTIVRINNIRHLENLYNDISGIDYTKPRYLFIKAEQNSDISWTDFQKKIESSTSNKNEVSIYDNEHAKNTSVSSNGNEWYFMPVNISGGSQLIYDGQGHSISDVEVMAKPGVVTDGGLFGANTHIYSVSNLALIDFSITGTSSAGALAGTLTDCVKVSNVVAYNNANKLDVDITANAGIAGGLIGILNGGIVEYSAAALTVKGTADAGGLIGKVSTDIGNSHTKSVSLTGCYAGGHTNEGEYYTHSNGTRGDAIYNITAGNSSSTDVAVGGLVGRTDSVNSPDVNISINYSYSTCSVKAEVAGTGIPKAGGLVGEGKDIRNIDSCYSTGLVYVNTSDTSSIENSIRNTGAFAGTLSDSAIVTNCLYFSIINEIDKEVVNNSNAQNLEQYLKPVGDPVRNDITAIDLDADSYNSFVGGKERTSDEATAIYSDGWQDAKAYDDALVKYYGGKYNLETVYQLYKKKNNADLYNPTSTPVSGDYFVKVHYGDWPAPEVMIINTK